MEGLLFLVIGLVFGAVLAWLWAQRRAGNDAGRTDELCTHLQRAQDDRSSLQIRLESEGQAKVKAETQLGEAERNLKQQQQLLEEAKACRHL